MRALFLLPVGSQVRYHKRIQGMLRAGVDVEVMYFQRDYYPGAPLPVPSTCLGEIRAGHYAERVPRLLRARRAVRERVGTFDIVYACGLDMLLLGLSAARGSSGAPAVVYEVGDINHYTDHGLKSALFRAVERRALRRVSVLVVTAPLFADDYYVPVQGFDRGRIKVLENKLDPEWLPAGLTPRRPEPGVLAIGYFGLVRCAHSWETLKRIARLGGDRVRIELRGVLLLDGIEAELGGLPNVHYGGTYVEPDDLAALYASVDVSWTAHHEPPSSGWARSNRFYKACAFHMPQIAAAGSADGDAVAELGAGLVVDLTRPAEAAEHVLSITPEEMAVWSERAARVDSSVYAYGGDHEDLLEMIAATTPGAARVVA